MLASLPGLREKALAAAQEAAALEEQVTRNNLSIQFLRLGAEVNAHKAAQALCFHECEQLLNAPSASEDEKAACAGWLEELLEQLGSLRAETERLFSLVTSALEVEDEMQRRWTQEEALMRDYLSRLNAS